MSGNQRRTPELLALGGAAGAGAVRGVALLLPGGAVRGHGRASRVAAWGMAAPGRRLAGEGRADGVAVLRLRYRFRGWNGPAADTLADTRWALDAVRAAHGDGVRIALLGNSLGGRAAFRAADHPGVVAVAGVAPWLPAGEPVGQLAGRPALIVHGDRDHGEAGAAQSLAYAERARAATALRRLEVPGAGHLLLSRAADAWAPAVDFLLDALAGRDPFHRLPPEDAAAPLRTPVPVGYGTRH
ncbi:MULTISPECIES: alpha/beta hydrolase [Kitasatospora]|uniref:Serine aminopeptidase S33 domain-containing protein n=1 Tax=Kitasatospora setae (strain ATCC 33774 / DSM 43861 / JCM 3304 / KCC A-0304 / NBRC 14216 / KM-6054) TaxID=452652 RepID=E4N6L2_KITSK|nr:MULTISPECIES: alpha/beta hydrolase [Kitasatospora]BAJ26843.1 hypothetical protein KSE_10080 [Kitasatospora setae KM-6054]